MLGGFREEWCAWEIFFNAVVDAIADLDAGGHVKPDVYYNILKYTRKYGAEAAASFARFEAANVLAVRDLVEKEQIDCDFVLTRAIDAYLDDDHAKATEDIYRELLRTGAADLSDISFTTGEEAEEVSREFLYQPWEAFQE